MKTAYLLAVFLLFNRQDEPQKPVAPNVKNHDAIAITIPKFYESTVGAGSWSNDAPKLIYPKTADRRYFLNIVDLRGFCVEPDCEVDQERFYAIIRGILRYGVADNPCVFPNLNAYFLHLLKRLFDFGVIDVESIRQLRVHYVNMNWVESLYYLDEAVPGSVPAAEWRRIYAAQPNLSGVDGPRCSYFEFLCELKAGASVNYLLENLDKRFDRELSRNSFDNYAKIYGILTRRGAMIRPAVARELARSYLELDEKYVYGFPAASKASGIQFPREIIEEILSEYVRRQKKPAPNVVSDFRLMRLAFPKELASEYRDALLDSFGCFEDVEYMLSIAGSESEPEFWKKYANTAWAWYKSRDIRKGIYDPGDNYHAAIEAYRRVQEFVEKSELQLLDKYDAALRSRVDKLIISEQRREQLAKAGEDQNIRTRDLIFAYKFLGLDPKKSAFTLEKLEKRVEGLRSRQTGVYHDAIGDHVWRLNDFGIPLVPFADSIELAAYLEDPIRTRELADMIATYAIQRIRSEAKDLEVGFERDYAQKERIWSRARLPFWLNGKRVLGRFKNAIQEKALRSERTAAFVEIDGIISYYDSLNFKIGLRSLGQYLFEYCLDLPARRAFHLAGLGKEAEEQCFSKKTDEFWRKKQEEFVYQVRLKAIADKK